MIKQPEKTQNFKAISTGIQIPVLPIRQCDPIALAHGLVVPGSLAETGVNANVAVYGATGSGKTTSITKAQLLHTKNESVVVALSKKSDVELFTSLLKRRGYEVDIIDFQSPYKSTVGYDPLIEVETRRDIAELSREIVYAGGEASFKSDPFWDEASVSLTNAMISAILERYEDAIMCVDPEELQPELHPTLEDAADLLFELIFAEDGRSGFTASNLDAEMEALKQLDPFSYAARNFAALQKLAPRTVSCVLSTAKVAMDKVLSPAAVEVSRQLPKIDLSKLGKKKSALFILTTPTQASTSAFTSILYSRIFKALLDEAATKPNGELDVPVKLLLDDLACGDPVPNLGKNLSICRAAGISVEFFLQSKAQLRILYGEREAQIIIDNCDTQIFMSNNDLETAHELSLRLDVPLSEALNIPLAKEVVARRGSGATILPRYQTFEDPEYITLIKQMEIGEEDRTE